MFIVLFFFLLFAESHGINMAEGMNVSSSYWYLTFQGHLAVDNSDVTFAALKATQEASWLAVDLTRRKLFVDVYLFAKFKDESTDASGGDKRLWILRMVKLRIPSEMDNMHLVCWKSETLNKTNGYIKENISCDNLMRILYRYVVVWAPAETRVIIFTFQVHDRRIGDMSKDLALNKKVLVVNNHQLFPGELAVDGKNMTCAYVHSNTNEVTWLAVDFGKNMAIGKINFLVKFRGLYEENFLAAKLLLEIQRPLATLSRGSDVCWVSQALRPGFKLMKVETSCIKALVLRPCRFLLIYTEAKNHMYVFDINIYDADFDDAKSFGGFEQNVPIKKTIIIITTIITYLLL